MNELEQRIYHDAARTAAEISASDIPPLRLDGRGRSRADLRQHGARQHGARQHGISPRPTSPGRHQPLRSGRAGRTAVRVLAPAAASAAVIALVVSLLVIGHGPAARPGHRSPTATPAGPSRAGRLLATQALDWYFPASGSTYTTGLAFGWAQDKITAADIGRCLATAGFPQPPFHGTVRQYQLSFPSGQFPDLGQLAAHPGQHVFTGQYPVVRHDTTRRMNEFDRAQARCTARYAQPVTRVNTAAASLQNGWITIITGIELSRPVRATRPAFTRCLERHGVPASLAQTPDTPGNPLFAGYDAWADTVNQAATSVKAEAADQRHEDRVFVACARPVVRVLEAIQLPRRARFFRQHAAQIALIARLAQHMS